MQTEVETKTNESDTPSEPVKIAHLLCECVKNNKIAICGTAILGIPVLPFQKNKVIYCVVCDQMACPTCGG